jgi:hypothetical protein
VDPDYNSITCRFLVAHGEKGLIRMLGRRSVRLPFLLINKPICIDICLDAAYAYDDREPFGGENMDRYYWLYQNNNMSDVKESQLTSSHRHIKRPMSVIEQNDANYPGVAPEPTIPARTELRFGLQCS